MTVAEYLNYCAALRGIPKSDKQSMLVKTSERCGLQDVQWKLIANLSKGFQQRVGIAQAIIHQPDVVILDEPTVGLDPIQINQIRQLIRELGKDHAVILSTHILPEVQAVCDRVQIINHGETVFSDSFDTLTEKHTASEVIVSFEGEVESKLLEKIVGVNKVEILTTQQSNNSRFRLHYQDKHDTNEIIKLSLDQGWKLLELTPQTETLEQIFMNLVYSDTNIKAEKETANA